ncbi:MAG: DUF2950 domain-containing protein [Candidatus Sulfotelmatobacter sp.]
MRWLGLTSALAALVSLGIVSNLEAAQSEQNEPKHAAATRPSTPEGGQKTFSSPAEACKALVEAVKNDDQSMLLSVLGAKAKAIVNSGDDAEDKQDRDQFVQKYQQMHRLMNEPDGTTTLYIGAENWPTPIPLVHQGNQWYFDTAAGKQEILYRRIGKNEMAAIQVCDELVDAQKEYQAQTHDGDSERQYAQKFTSDPGKQNGLYWESSGNSRSPIGPLVAVAATESVQPGTDQNQQPFQGYYFRILKRQGAKAQGGAKNYVVDGKMTGGFAFIAYPADYRSSGVMTFVVNQDGIVYEKDLGPKTAALAKSMKEYNPDGSWRKAD